MPEYEYPQDNRIHTRFSELVKCTPGQIRNVVLERYGLIPHFSSPHTGIGSTRHEMYEEEMYGTGRIPECFLDVCPQFKDVAIRFIEKEFKAEIFKDVVLHSTPDAISESDGIIFDFKVTSQEAKKYKASRQLLVYAYQMFIRKIEIKKVVFLIEKWDKAKTEIIGYDCYAEDIDREKVLEVKAWLKDRVEILLAGLEAYKNEALWLNIMKPVTTI